MEEPSELLRFPHLSASPGLQTAGAHYFFKNFFPQSGCPSAQDESLMDRCSKRLAQVSAFPVGIKLPITRRVVPTNLEKNGVVPTNSEMVPANGFSDGAR